MDFLKRPNSDFAAVRDGRQSLPLWMDIDLSVARSITGTGANVPLILNISGNSFFVDADTVNVGTAIVHFQDTNLGNASAPFYVAPGFVATVGFTQILVENAAQAGKRLRIFYGVDIDFRAGVNASTISGVVTVGNAKSAPANVVNSGFDYGVSYKSTTALAALTPEQVFSAAANVNGAIVWTAEALSGVGAGIQQCAFIAKAAAPVSLIDGDVVSISDFAFTNTWGKTKTSRPVKIPAGKGLYFIASLAESSAHRLCLYTLL